MNLTKKLIYFGLIISGLMLSDISFAQPRLTVTQGKVKPLKKGEPIDFTTANAIAANAFQNIMDMTGMEKYSASSGQENYGTPDVYYVITFQKDGKPLLIGHVYPNGNIKYLLKLSPKGNTKQKLISKDQATILANKFVTDKLNASPKLYSLVSIGKEKAGKGVLAYYVAKFKREKPDKESKAVKTMEIKVHPKSGEIMAAAFDY